MKHQNCWLCHATLATQRQFERHVETVHQRLGVECPFCHVTIKRAADMKRHILTVHPDTKVPETAFHVREMACLAIFQDDFVRVYGQSRSTYHSFWQTISSGSKNTFSTLSVSYISIKHGSSTVEGQFDNQSFSLKLSDDIFNHPLILRRLAKRLAQLPLSNSPFDEFTSPVDADGDTKEKVARGIGVGVEHITSIKFNHVPSFVLVSDDLSGGSTPLLDEVEITATSTFEDSMGYPGQLLIQADYLETAFADDYLAGHSVVPVATSSSSVSSVPPISSITSQPAACVEVSRSIKTPIKAIIHHLRPTEIISSENSEFLVPSLPPTPSNQMRAKKLLAMGAMPLFPPARREWDQDEAVTFLEPKFKWPPRGWKGMSADLRLMLTEFQAMSILQARGCDFKFERVELLNAFNFLVLPGSLSPRAPVDTNVHSCHAIYVRLREIALGKEDMKWLRMIESASMMRDTANDKLIAACKEIPLRLKKK
ncbi:hypothetical protein DPMN_177483 [Dreissena polymorpha]|uniref:C2H2-type domain-containing protein n=1 Tax=Dreissena polymorpha TaxID=45954 RepID=A0A9D4ED47_DREPO|nr:hypothetical protein DPMN_177483 [Dreissena polymorpha]